MVRKQLNQFVWQHFARKYYFHPPLLGLMQFYSAVQKKCCCLLLFSSFSTDNNIFDSLSQFSNLQQLCVHRFQFFVLSFTFPSLCYARSGLVVVVVSPLYQSSWIRSVVSEFSDSLRRRASARNVSFRISSRWPIHIINSVDKTKLFLINCRARNPIWI